MVSPVQQLRERYGSLIETSLRVHTEGKPTDRELWGMLQYQLGFVDESLQPVQAPAGKRFRPGMCMLTCEAVGGTPDDALTAAVAIELLHNFSLIHDDIEDDDPQRRHRPTVWKIWGKPLAINAGDAMFALATRLILDSSPDADAAGVLGRAFSAIAFDLTHGQYLDMSFEDRSDVHPDEYIRMIGLKTAALIRFSAWSGARVAGAPQETLEALLRYGFELGKGFQIRDDIMGIWGSKDETGKIEAQDLRKRKKTFPVLVAMERADSRGRIELSRFFDHQHDDLEMVLTVLNDTDAKTSARESANHFLIAALEALDAAQLAPTFHDQLRGLAIELSGQRLPTS